MSQNDSIILQKNTLVFLISDPLNISKLQRSVRQKQPIKIKVNAASITENSFFVSIERRVREDFLIEKNSVLVCQDWFLVYCVFTLLASRKTYLTCSVAIQSPFAQLATNVPDKNRQLFSQMRECGCHTAESDWGIHHYHLYAIERQLSGCCECMYVLEMVNSAVSAGLRFFDWRSRNGTISISVVWLGFITLTCSRRPHHSVWRFWRRFSRRRMIFYSFRQSHWHKRSIT